MLSKELIIRVNKCVLVLSENELMGALAAKPELFESAIKRGKGLLRAQNVERRQNTLDRWAVFEALSGNPKYLNSEVAHAVETINMTELREGVIEFLLTRLQEKQSSNF